MKTFAATAAMVALLGLPAYAQSGFKDTSKTPQQLIDEQKRREQADIDRRYENRAKTPDAEAQNDPWRTIRPAAPANQKR